MTIEYDLKVNDFVYLSLHDLTGREVTVFVNVLQEKGNHQVTWNATAIPDGIYFLLFHHGKNFEAIKIVVKRR
jgi:hypothetical protein